MPHLSGQSFQKNTGRISAYTATSFRNCDTGFCEALTQTGKFKVVPTVAHQTRFGQFRMEDPDWGATLASLNKVFFALSSADTKEVPLEHVYDSRRRHKDTYGLGRYNLFIVQRSQ